jgi:glycosyltransferase involved in cell wall biosynthesis
LMVIRSQADTDMLKVLIAAQTPPPYGGMPIMVQRLLDSELPGIELVHVRLSFSSDANELGRFSIWKVVYLFVAVAQIAYRRIVDGPRVLYYVPAGPERMPMYRDFVILLATRWMFEKTVFHFHLAGISELYDRLPRWQQWIFRRAYFGADAAIRLSELNPEDGRRLEAKRNYVVANGIDDPFPERSGEAAAGSENPEGRLRILFVAILYESKGLMVLIDACARLAARGIPFQLEVMGPWQKEEYATRVHEWIRELNLSRSVTFLGRIIGPEKFAPYRKADVFCFPTYFQNEAMPVVLLEAMACRLPIVATRWRGIPSMVDDGHTGFLVEPRDAEAVADRLEQLARDSELRLQLGAAGRRRFEQEFVISRHLEQLRNVLLEVGGLQRKPVGEIPQALATT